MLQQLGTIKCGNCDKQFKDCKEIAKEHPGAPKCECVCHKSWEEMFDKRFLWMNSNGLQKSNIKKFIQDLLTESESQIRADEAHRQVGEVIKMIEGMKLDERKAKEFGYLLAETYQEKTIINAVLDEVLTQLRGK